MTTLSICITCQHEEQRPGTQILSMMQEKLANTNIHTQGVECMSVCKRPCTVSFSAPGKWSYVVGDITAADIDAVCDYAKTYHTSEHGTPPLKERPAAIRRGTIARIPPQPKDSYANS